MEATVSWTGTALDESGSEMGFIGRTGSGHIVAMDGAPSEGGGSIGGRNLAPRPMEVVLVGTGGCTAYDVVMILRRGRHAVVRCDVAMKAERATTDPKVFTAIHFHFTVVGHALKPEVVDRAIKLSHEKLCSASVMLEKTAVLTHSFEIGEA
ncbi:MAG: OsmC family protein [Burkholderiaceae bacterium]